MRSLPRKAQIYVIFVYALGLLSVLGSEVLPATASTAAAWELAIFVCLGALAGSRKVNLVRHKNSDDSVTMSLGFALTAATMLRFGPSAALVVGALGTLFGCLFPLQSRQRPHQILFNVCLTAIETWTSGLLFVWLNGGTLELEPLRSFPAVIIYSVSCFLINTGGVAIVIALCTGQRIIRLWKETFLWTGPSYTAGACISTLAILILGSNTGAILLFGMPVAILMYQSYSVYSARVEENQQHIEERQLDKAQLADLYLATVESLALAIDAKDQYTHQHIVRVQQYAMATAAKLGLPESELKALETGALLHDIGKIGVPEHLLNKPGHLTDEEYAQIKKHPSIGAAILEPVPFPWPVLPVVRHHHEKWDGTGYPDGLKGEEIPFTARILAVADSYDAITSRRTYRSARTHEQAIAIIKHDIGTHFDPVVVEAFLEVIDPIVAAMAREGRGPLANRASASAAGVPARDIQGSSLELWALAEVDHTLSANLALQETLNRLASNLETIVPGAACLFLIKRDRLETLEARAVAGLNHEFFRNCAPNTPGGRTIQVAQTCETYAGEFDPEDLEITATASGEWTPLLSALIVPIVHESEVLGTINLYHPQLDAFGSQHRHLLELISQRAGFAVYTGLLREHARNSADTDPLTGLINLRHVTQALDDRIALSAGIATPAAFSLMRLDICNLQPIKEAFGHVHGDRVLRDIAMVLKAAVCPTDTVARCSGDEFLIVLNGAGAAEAHRAASRLRSAIRMYDPELVHPSQGRLRLGINIGCASYPDDGKDCAALISVAEALMNREKQEHRPGRLREFAGGAEDNTIDAEEFFRRAA